MGINVAIVGGYQIIAATPEMLALAKAGRVEFKALGVYQKFGNTGRADEILSNMHGMTPEAKVKALEVWKRNQK